MRLSALLAVATVAALSASCWSILDSAAAASVSPTVLATTDLWADVVSNVACDGLATVGTLIPSGTDPHTFEPSLGSRAALDAASLVVANGLGLEGSVDDLLDDVAADGTPVFRMSDHLPTLGDDPHIWWDPDGVRAAIPALADALVLELDLDRSAVDACAASYEAELAAVAGEMDDTLSVVPPDQRLLVTSHDSLQYFARRFGFTVVGAVIPSSSTMAEADPASLAALTALVEEAGVRSIFAEPEHSADETNALAERVAGVEVVVIPTGALGAAGSGTDTYLGFLRTNARTIAEALEPDSGAAPSAAIAGSELTAGELAPGPTTSGVSFITHPVAWWIDPFVGEPVMRDALYAGLLAVLATSVVGIWVVLRGMSFLGDALAHGVLPGIAVAFISGQNLTLGALVAALLMVGGINLIRSHSPLPEDTSIGVLFVGFLALAVVIMSRESSNYAGDLNRFLFGSILGISSGDLYLIAAAAGVSLLGVVVFYRSLLVMTFNETQARLLGLRPGLANVVLLVLLAFSIVASFRAVGNLLVFAFLVAPPATASLLVRRVPVMMAAAVTLGSVSVVAGLLIAFHYGTAPGATMALCSVVIFLVALTGRAVATSRGGRAQRRLV